MTAKWATAGEGFTPVTSFKIDPEQGRWLFPCCSARRQFVVRDQEGYGTVKNLDPLLDDVDTVLSVSNCIVNINMLYHLNCMCQETAFSPIIKLIIFILLYLLMIPVILFIVNGDDQLMDALIYIPIFVPIMVMSIISLAMDLYFYGKRISRLAEVLQQWNK